MVVFCDNAKAFSKFNVFICEKVIYKMYCVICPNATKQSTSGI